MRRVLRAHNTGMNDAKVSPTRKRLHVRALLGWGLLAASLLANVGLAFACREFYRREQLVRLHPTFPVPAPIARTEGRTQVLFLGDSRMEQWPDLPSNRFATVNAGGGGETTAQIRLRAAATLDAARPDLVVLQAGVNDLKTLGALPHRARETEARCLANLIALVDLCRERGARVVLVPILPASRPGLARRLVWSSEIDAARRRVNAALRRRFDGTAGVALLDEHILRPDSSADYRDTLHFRPEAYSKLEAATLKAFETL
jgi:lysophospholipase L1-like esterase